MVLALERKPEDALKAFWESVRIKPSAEGYHNIGAALQNQGKPNEAVEAYRKALELQPDRAEVYVNLGYSLQA
jgi:Flp pilus assembly protein TadD